MEFRQSFHVRLKPAPYLVLVTSTAINDRLEVQEEFVNGGVYRRISRQFISQLQAEIEKTTDTGKRDRLGEILSVCRSSPGSEQDDLGNPPIPTLYSY